MATPCVVPFSLPGPKAQTHAGEQQLFAGLGAGFPYLPWPCCVNLNLCISCLCVVLFCSIVGVPGLPPRLGSGCTVNSMSSYSQKPSLIFSSSGESGLRANFCAFCVFCSIFFFQQLSQHLPFSTRQQPSKASVI